MNIFAFEEFTYPGLDMSVEPEVRIPCSRLVIIKGTGHFPQKEKPQTFLRVVCNYLLGRDEPVDGARVVS